MLTKDLIIDAISKQTGVDTEDINIEDSLVEDLHMRPTDITDFLEALGEEDSDAAKIDLTKIETIEDILEELNIEF